MVMRQEADDARARRAIMTRMISAGTAALTFTPSAMPLSSPAYHVSTRTSDGLSTSPRGTANTSAANSAAA